MNHIWQGRRQVPPDHVQRSLGALTIVFDLGSVGLVHRSIMAERTAR
jgi:hypothetical protein